MSTRASRKRKLADTDLQPAEELNPNPSKRREATVGMMIGFLEELRRIKHPEKVVQKEVKPWKPKLHTITTTILRHMWCSLDMGHSLNLVLSGTHSGGSQR